MLSLTSLKRSRSRNITTGSAVRLRRARAMLLSQTVDEQEAIRQPRQGIVQDLVRQLGLGELFLEARCADHPDHEEAHDDTEGGDALGLVHGEERRCPVDPIASWPQAMATTVQNATTRHALEPHRAMLSTAMIA